MAPLGDRARAVERIRRRLLRRGWPRLVATTALLVAGAVGFLASFIMLSAGLSDMAIRYAIATSLAYLAFLLCLRLLVALTRRRLEPDPFDVIDLVVDGEGGSTGSPAPEVPTAEIDAPGSGLGLPVPDFDEGLALLVPLCVAGAALLAVVYTVAIAPALLAELLLDSIIVAGLARRFARAAWPGAGAEGVRRVPTGVW